MLPLLRVFVIIALSCSTVYADYHSSSTSCPLGEDETSLMQTRKTVAFGSERSEQKTDEESKDVNQESTSDDDAWPLSFQQWRPPSGTDPSSQAPFQGAQRPDVLAEVNQQGRNRYAPMMPYGEGGEDPHGGKEEEGKSKTSATEERKEIKKEHGAHGMGTETMKGSMHDKSDFGDHGRHPHAAVPFLLREDPVLEAAKHAWVRENEELAKSYKHAADEFSHYVWRKRHAEEDLIARKRLEVADWVANKGVWEKAYTKAAQDQRDMLIRADSEVKDAYIRAPTEDYRWAWPPNAGPLR